MFVNPLARPVDREALDLFLRHFAIAADEDARATLLQVTRAFSRLPYENLTKIV